MRVSVSVMEVEVEVVFVIVIVNGIEGGDGDDGEVCRWI